MNSDVVVVTYEGAGTAQIVCEALKVMRKSQILGLGDSVVMFEDSAGQFRLQQETGPSAGLARLLAEMILRSPERVVPGPDGAELDDGFVGAVVAALRHHRSALLFFIDSDSLSDTCELLNALALFRGTIHQTTLTPQSDVLLRASV